MKRLYICSFKDDDWIAGIVAHSHKQAKKIFNKIHKSHHDDSWWAFLDIRIRLSKSNVNVSKLEIGEIEYDWGFKNGIYTEMC